MIHVMDLAGGNMAEAKSYYGKAGSDATTDLREILEKQQADTQQNSESLYQQIQAGSVTAGTAMILFSLVALALLAANGIGSPRHPSRCKPGGGLPASGLLGISASRQENLTAATSSANG